jgi:hypothetical protein
MLIRLYPLNFKLKFAGLLISPGLQSDRKKLRSGYESSCLLLTACAEAKQISDRSGNILIANIDKEFKRYTAFRRELKTLTKESRVLSAVT